jgi:ParB family chromosome partitioning protein
VFTIRTPSYYGGTAKTKNPKTKGVNRMAQTKQKEPDKLEQISLDRIEPPRNVARIETIEEGLDDLADSIKKHGVIEPIIVRKKGNSFEIVAGHRRYLATQKAGKVMIPCIVITGNDKKVESVKVHENLYRVDMNPVEEAVFYTNLIQSDKWTIEDIRKACGRSIRYVQQRLEMVKWPPEILRAVSYGTITLSVAMILMQIKDEKTRAFYVDITIRSGANIAQAQRWRDEANAPKDVPPIPEVGAEEAQPTTASAAYRPTCWLCGEAHELADMVTVQIDRKCAATLREAQKAADANSGGS